MKPQKEEPEMKKLLLEVSNLIAKNGSRSPRKTEPTIGLTDQCKKKHTKEQIPLQKDSRKLLILSGKTILHHTNHKCHALEIVILF